jgi:hypothetical protein
MIGGMRVIDAHQHVGDVSEVQTLPEGATPLHPEQAAAEKLARRLERMAASGTDPAGLAPPGHVRASGLPDTRRVNDEAIFAGNIERVLGS